MFKYSIKIMWSTEDTSYVATVPKFPGLSAFGESPEEALKEAMVAIEGFLAVYAEDGTPIPEPDTLDGELSKANLAA
jgi:predicted RNase H-like HicB family nuclease